MAYPILAPNSTWYKSSTLRSTITEINIVDTYIPTGSETETWNADVDNNGAVKCYRNGTILTIAGNGSGKIAMNADSSYTFSNSGSDRFKSVVTISSLALLDASSATTFSRLFLDCNVVVELDVGGWNTGNVTDMVNTFGRCEALSTLDISNWNVSNVRTMENMFQSAYSLQSLDLSNWDVGKVTSMRRMFVGADEIQMSLTTIGDVSNWNVGNVINMYCMFYNCGSLTSLDVSNWDVSNVTNMYGMFYSCTALTSLDVSNWDTSSCTDMGSMFRHCFSLTTIGDVSNWDVGKVTNFASMFAGGDYGNPAMKIKNLNVSNWNTSSCTDMSFMFYSFQGCNLDLSKWNVSKVTTFDHMFAHSYRTIGDVSNWATPAATNMNAMFYSVANTVLDVSNLVTDNVTCFEQMFENCQNLTKIIGLEKFNTANSFGFAEMFSNCYKLKELDLSNFDTTKAKNGEFASTNSGTTRSMQNMFTNMYRLEKITLGEKFSFNGDGTAPSSAAVLPTPSYNYIELADGNWYTEDGIAYAPANIPSRTAGTYYAYNKSVADKDYLASGRTILKLVNAIKNKVGSSDALTMEQIISIIKNRLYLSD